MNAASVSVQVLSVSGPGAELLAATAGPAFAREYNDRMAQAQAIAIAIAAHPTQFAGFAYLSTTNPAAAAGELERTVKTTVSGAHC
ncbi:hypothetical protein [Hymenobacter terricola]|uniref:hypothetical protein n=1 Tax=Hymenobacter terricola TaxID=2819236 RepID=UPI001B30CC8B|nr:hypothetical protein [Hymenobacter terricola]